MSIEIQHQLFTPEKQLFYPEAEVIAAGIAQEGDTMVPVSPETLLLSPLSLVLSIGESLAAFGRIKGSNEQKIPVICSEEAPDTPLLAGEYRQLGSLWVHQDFRKRGLGKLVIKKLTEEGIRMGLDLYAFCRTLDSAARFTSCGYLEAVATYPGLKDPNRPCVVFQPENVVVRAA
ncbi:GNAT family N-acetyltransferase [Candidatus Saccharibacteria bacterium]|nr:MAG: GNAT family N-acetyltransferase [Candidatus Saccharibacteria bacterium]